MAHGSLSIRGSTQFRWPFLPPLLIVRIYMLFHILITFPILLIIAQMLACGGGWNAVPCTGNNSNGCASIHRHLATLSFSHFARSRHLTDVGDRSLRDIEASGQGMRMQSTRIIRSAVLQDTFTASAPPPPVIPPPVRRSHPPPLLVYAFRRAQHCGRSLCAHAGASAHSPAIINLLTRQ